MARSRVLAWKLVVVPAFDHASAVLAGRIMVAEALAIRYGVEPPKLTDLAPLLLDLRSSRAKA